MIFMVFKVHSCCHALISRTCSLVLGLQNQVLQTWVKDKYHPSVSGNINISEVSQTFNKVQSPDHAWFSLSKEGPTASSDTRVTCLKAVQEGLAALHPEVVPTKVEVRQGA